MKKPIRKFLSLFLVALFLLPMAPVVGITAAAYTSVTTVPAGFTGIYNATQLNSVRNSLNGKYILMANINLSGKGNWSPIGTNYSAPFTGVFDGNGYSVIGMNVNASVSTGSTAYSGLFGVVLGGEVKNLSVAGNVTTTITGVGDLFAYSGGIVGSLEDGTVSNCYNWADVKAISTSVGAYIYAGGIAGENYDGTIELCYNNGKISAGSNRSAYAGGITANNYGDLRLSFNLNSVTANAVDVAASAGGITGYSTFDHVVDCFNVGAVTATVGSILPQGQSLTMQSLENAPYIKAPRPGESEQMIVQSIVPQAEVNNTNVAAAGGVVGFSDRGTLGSAYNAAQINASAPYSYAGGVMGINSGSSANTYFANGLTSLGSGYVYSTATNQTTGLTDAQMRNITSFPGFNGSTWQIDPNSKFRYPQLRQLPVGDMIDNSDSSGNGTVIPPTQKKAIYILPGYLGSELYDSQSKSAKRLWTDLGPLQKQHEDLINTNSDGSSNGKFFAFSVDIFDNGKDDYGAQDTYKKLVVELKEKFGSKYDVKFFAYNWLGDINDVVKEIEEDAKGYDKIVFVTHSTGGLVASAYAAKSANRGKIEKIVMIAPPLYGTYAALFPLERGDSRKGIPLIDIATNNKWVKKIVHNSPTTYQLLPNANYFATTRALDLRTKKNSWYKADEWTNNAGWDDFYKTLDGSENINGDLLLNIDNERSHINFRKVSLGENGSATIFDTLQNVNTTIIGTVHGRSTPKTAQYDISEGYDKAKLVDVKYDKAGDGTVYNTSMGIVLNESTDNVTSLLETYYYSDLFDGWFGGIKQALVNPPDHTDLVKTKEVLDKVVELIGDASKSPSASSNGVSDSWSASGSVRPQATGLEEGMEAYVKLRIESEKDIAIHVFDSSDNLVAYSYMDEQFGFDDEDFICNQFGDDGETLTSIYLPKVGYKARFFYGDTAGTSVNLSVTVSLLDFEGDVTGYGSYDGNITVANGEIFTLNMTSGVTDTNIDKLLLPASYPGLDVDSEIYDTWELDFSAANKPNDVVVLNSITAKATIGINGSINPALISWSSSDESVVTVLNGVLTATGYGRAMITATAMDNSEKSEMFHVKVKLSATSIHFVDFTLAIGERALIIPTYNSDRVTEKRVDYVYTPGVIQIVNDVVFALAPGSVVVTGTAYGGATSTFKVTVVGDTSPTTYTLTLNANGGTVTPPTVTQATGTTYTLPTPTRSGYTFTSWTLSGGGSLSGNTYTFGTSNGTVTAQWTATPTNYTLTLNANGGSVTPTSVAQATGTTYNIPAPTRSGYSFNGWSLSGGGSLSGNTYTFGTSNGTVTAQWTAIQQQTKKIFSTKYDATFLNWILFFVCFGWIWMWF